MWKKIITGSIVALAVAALAAAPVFAQEPPPPECDCRCDPTLPGTMFFRFRRGAWPPGLHRGPLGFMPWPGPDEFEELQELAPDELIQELKDMTIERIEQAVEDGKLDEERAEEMIERIQEWEGVYPGPGRLRMFRWAPSGGALADALGMSGVELAQALEDGKTLAEIAEEQDVPLADVAEALLAPATGWLDQLVEQDLLSEETADDVRDEVQGNLLDKLESGEDLEGLPTFVPRVRGFVERHWPDWLPRLSLPDWLNR
jgi:hypothetical protein